MPKPRKLDFTERQKRARDRDPLPVVMVGNSTELVSVRSLEHEFQISRRAAIDMLTALRVKPVFIGAHAYFSIQALDSALFYVTMLGGPGFVAPGSLIKDKRGTKSLAKYAQELTDKDVATMHTQTFRRTMEFAARQRGRFAMATVKKLVAASADRSDVITADEAQLSELAETPVEDVAPESPVLEALRNEAGETDVPCGTAPNEQADPASP